MADADDNIEDDSRSTDSNDSLRSPTKRMSTRRTGCSTRGARAVGSRRNLNSRARACNLQRSNLLKKLHLRQLSGKIQYNRVTEDTKMFSRLPGRLAFFIRDAVPHSALTSGHVFLGFSRCGQFLLSYTQTNTENEQFDLSFNYYYR